MKKKDLLKLAAAGALAGAVMGMQVPSHQSISHQVAGCGGSGYYRPSQPSRGCQGVTYYPVQPVYQQPVYQQPAPAASCGGTWTPVPAPTQPQQGTNGQWNNQPQQGSQNGQWNNQPQQGQWNNQPQQSGQSSNQPQQSGQWSSSGSSNTQSGSTQNSGQNANNGQWSNSQSSSGTQTNSSGQSANSSQGNVIQSPSQFSCHGKDSTAAKRWGHESCSNTPQGCGGYAGCGNKGCGGYASCTGNNNGQQAQSAKLQAKRSQLNSK